MAMRNSIIAGIALLGLWRLCHPPIRSAASHRQLPGGRNQRVGSGIRDLHLCLCQDASGKPVGNEVTAMRWTPLRRTANATTMGFSKGISRAARKP